MPYSCLQCCFNSYPPNSMFKTKIWLQSFAVFHAYAEDSIWSSEVALIRSLGRASRASCIFLLALWKASDRENKCE